MASLKKNISYILVGVLLFLLLTQRCSNSSRFKEQKSNYESIISFNDKRASEHLLKVNMQADTIITLKQNITNEKIASEQLKNELYKFKKVNVYLEGKLTTGVSDFRVRTEIDTIYKYVDKDGYIHEDSVNKVFSFNDDWASINGNIYSESIYFKELKFKNEFDVVIGNKKVKGLFKKAEPVVELKSYSPYTNVPYINNIVVKDDRSKVAKWFFSKPAFFAYGFIASSFLNRK